MSRKEPQPVNPNIIKPPPPPPPPEMGSEMSGRMTKIEAINILARYVANDIQANNFWNDEAYEQEIEALRKLGRLNKKEINQVRPRKEKE